MSTYKDHPFYTHQPFFQEILKCTTGNVLECGCGEGSTPMIRKALENTDRILVTLESDLEWLKRYTHLSGNTHFLYHIPVGNEDSPETGKDWIECIQEYSLPDFEIVFIDSSPWHSRKSCLEYFLDKADIILIHDFDYFPNTNLIGKTTKKETYLVNGKSIEKIECDLDSVVNHSKLFYPPDPFFAGPTGPPTLVCSNRLSKEKFNSLIQTIEANVPSYYV